MRVTGQALKLVAFAGLLAGAVSLSGCSTLGSAAFGDTTGSIDQNRLGSTNQAMPPALGKVQRVASGPYVPPNDIGSGGGGDDFATSSMPMGSVSTEALPALTSKGSSSTMSAQPSLAPVTVGTKTAPLGSTTAKLAQPEHNLAVVPANAYVHVIESGEFLYTIARHYDVTAQAIVQANGIVLARQDLCRPEGHHPGAQRPARRQGRPWLPGSDEVRPSSPHRSSRRRAPSPIPRCSKSA